MAEYGSINGGKLVMSEGGGMRVRRINGMAYGPDQALDFPVIVPLANGHAQVLDAAHGAVVFSDDAATGGNPSEGEIFQGGTFTYTLWDGATEGDTLVCELWIRGATAPMLAVAQTGEITRYNGQVVTTKI